MLRSKASFSPESIAKALKRPEPEEPAPRPAPPPPQSNRQVSVNISLSGIVSAATWAWSHWSQYKDGLAKQEQMILQLAEDRFGWLSVNDVVQNVGISVKSAHQSLDRLIEAGIAEAVLGKDGKTIYLFPHYLPRFAPCAYCETEQLLGYITRCTQCGGPLPE